MAKFRWVPFTIQNNATASAPVDIGPVGIVVGISIHGTWTPAKIAFLSYVPESGKYYTAGPAIGIDNAYFDPNAAYDFVRDDQGVTLTFGDGSAGSSQYLQWWGSTKAFQGIYGFRFMIVASVSGSVTASGVIRQAQLVTGYILVRDDS